MPDFIADFNRLCHRHLSYILATLIGGAGTILWAAMVWGGDISERVTAAESQISTHNRQLIETRQTLEEINNKVTDIAVDTAVIKERVEGLRQ